MNRDDFDPDDTATPTPEGWEQVRDRLRIQLDRSSERVRAHTLRCPHGCRHGSPACTAGERRQVAYNHALHAWRVHHRTEVPS